MPSCYHTLIIVAWFGITIYCDYLKNRLQKLQNRAARIITGKTYEVSSEDVLTELDWQPLNQRYKTNKLFFMHRIYETKKCHHQFLRCSKLE